MNGDRPITLLVCALGGEGGGVLSEWLVEIARHAGYAAQSTSIPGVAQRTGATTYYIEVFPQPIAALGGRCPVFSLNPVPGALDAIVSSELLETTRQIGAGMSSPERTLVITSSARTLTTEERMKLGDGRADSAPWLQVLQAFSHAHHVFDMSALAQQAGTAVSAVMLGAIAGSGLFPFAREHYMAVVRESGGSAGASLRGFERAFEIVSENTCHPGLDPAMTDQDCHAGLDPASSSQAHDGGLRVKPAMTNQDCHAGLDPVPGFPEAVRDIVALGHARMLEYQDRAYGELYLERLRSVLAAEREADPQALHGYATTREMARWLALWMAFDDIVRVADLKSRATRWERVKGEVKAGGDDLLRVWDHFKPGAAEFAALLPAGLAERVLRWDARRVRGGKNGWALPLKIATHSVFGMLALRTLASLRWLRVRSSRYANEQAMLARWLAVVVDGTRRDWRLGHEIALCGRLIKGYGTTNERGKQNLQHVLDHLAHGPDAAQAAGAIAAAREAALADDAGQAFDATLLRHGAPARPVREQPIRFVRRPADPGKA